MPSPKTTQKRKRLSLDLTPQVKLRIEKLRDSTNAESITEVIRRSLATYELLCDAQANGKSIVVRDSDGSNEQTVLLLS